MTIDVGKYTCDEIVMMGEYVAENSELTMEEVEQSTAEDVIEKYYELKAIEEAKEIWDRLIDHYKKVIGDVKEKLSVLVEKLPYVIASDATGIDIEDLRYEFSRRQVLKIANSYLKMNENYYKEDCCGCS